MEFSSAAGGSLRNEGYAHAGGMRSTELLHAASLTRTFHLAAVKAGPRVFQNLSSLLNHLKVPICITRELKKIKSRVRI